MDLQGKYGMNVGLQEFINKVNLLAALTTSYSTIPYDYGTGEMYTSLEVHTVSAIHLHPGITAKEIAESTARTQSAVSQTIKKLTEKGLVTTEKDPKGNRRTLLYVTEKGEKLNNARLIYDENTMGVVLERFIEKYGIDSVNNFYSIVNEMTDISTWL